MELPLGIGDPVAAGLVLERRWDQQHLVRCDEAAKVDGNNPELSFLLERSCVGMTLLDRVVLLLFGCASGVLVGLELNSVSA
jgi:hypothetical protein